MYVERATRLEPPPTADGLRLERLQQAAGGRKHSLLLTLGGTLFSCGDNDYEQLGRYTGRSNTGSSMLNDVAIRSTPSRVECVHFMSRPFSQYGRVTQVACGQNHSIAIVQNVKDGPSSVALAWGCDEARQLGAAEPILRQTNPFAIPLVVWTSLDYTAWRVPVQVVAGVAHSAVLDDRGHVHFFGGDGMEGPSWCCVYQDYRAGVCHVRPARAHGPFRDYRMLREGFPAPVEHATALAAGGRSLILADGPRIRFYEPPNDLQLQLENKVHYWTGVLEDNVADGESIRLRKRSACTLGTESHYGVATAE